MGIKFGEFLIKRGKITEKQLKTALSQQAEEHYKFGETGLFFGKIEDDQVDIVLKAMTEEKHAGKKFGEIAKEMKFIFSDDIEEILELEEQINVRIGKILAMSGYISQKEVDRALREFKKSGHAG